MSAQQVRALFDSSSLLLGYIVQRIADTWRMHEAEALQQLLLQLAEQCRLGNTEKFYDLIFQYLARQPDMVGKFIFNEVLSRVIAIVKTQLLF